MTEQKKTLWSGRFAESPDRAAVDFETSIRVDSRLAADDIRGSRAHVKMLGDTGIIPAGEAASIATALDGIARDLENGALQIDETTEDIHSFIEGVLTERLGEIGKKVHTGRSRNDQIALDERLYLRRAVPELQQKLCALITVLTDIAVAHKDTLFSGYTHMQHAQPVTLAAHLCAWCRPLVRDHGRLADALARIDQSPLGAGALATSSLPLDREQVARELGFAGVTQSSLDTVADRDYCVELCAAFSLIMTHLSRYCEEIVLWSSTEFGFIELSEKWSTGSSIMPQKKNPDFAELIRGRTGLVYGNLIALLTMLKGLPLSYNRDLQEDKVSLFAAYDTVSSCLEVFTAMVATAKWNKEPMAASVDGGFGNATDVAEYLVRKGLPFRDAHAVSAQVVRHCIDKNMKNIADLTLDEIRAFSPLFEADLFTKISPEACVAARNITGGPAPDAVETQIRGLREFTAGSF
jgi:argininosuccinate lyase